MKPTEIKFTRRYNVAQYEHEEYSVTALLEDDDSAVDGLVELKEQVAAAYGGGACVGESDEDTSSTDESNEEETGEEDTEAEDSENDSDSEESDEADENNEDEEESAPSPKSSKKSSTTKADSKTSSAKAGKKFKAKPQVYDRENDTHKKLFSDVLKAVAPDWKKSDASKAKAKSVSQKMAGKEFLDANGVVVSAFKAEVKKLMGKK